MPFAQTGKSTPISEERKPDRKVDDGKPAEQLDDAEERDDERREIDRPPRRGQLQREGDKHLTKAQHDLPPPGQGCQLVFVEPSREKIVRVASIVREEALEIFPRQITSVGVKPLAGAVGGWRRLPPVLSRGRRRHKGSIRAAKAGCFAGV